MAETRIIRGEIRDCGQMRVRGIAARYGNPTTVTIKNGRFREVLASGAFRSAVNAKQDTKFLINHDQNRLMGSVAAGTLRLRDTDEGLEFEADLPESVDGRNAYESIKRGDLSECSFAMEDVEDAWDIDTSAFEDERSRPSRRMARRTIKNIGRLLDVSAVTFPAYGNTSIGLRAEQRSEIEIPQEFVVVEEPETDSVEVIARRRQLLGISLL